MLWPGAFNGLMITTFQIPPFIVTLSMMMMASGLSFLPVVRAIRFPNCRRRSSGWAVDRRCMFPIRFLLMIVLYVVAHLVMSCGWSSGGTLYAIGGNSEAARMSGVPVKRILLTVYTILPGRAPQGAGWHHADFATFGRRSQVWSDV